MLIHHFIGLTIVILWVYINLVFLRHLQSKFGIKAIMRIAMALWMLSLVIGIHMFLLVYV
jgi:hypothetical protein